MERPDSRIPEPHSGALQPPIASCGSLPASTEDPPVVVQFPSTTVEASDYTVSGILKRLEKATGGRQNTTEVYGVPRVFDLFTLMAMTLAFALLFALLKLLSPAFDASATALTLVISGYVVLIALAQMFMFNGENPRLSSIMAGPLAMLTIMIIAWIPFEVMPVIQALAMAIIFSVFFGFLFGYLAGAVVAGVLLVADAMRGRSVRHRSPLVTADREVTFDDVE